MLATRSEHTYITFLFVKHLCAQMLFQKPTVFLSQISHQACIFTLGLDRSHRRVQIFSLYCFFLFLLLFNLIRRDVMFDYLLEVVYNLIQLCNFEGSFFLQRGL